MLSVILRLASERYNKSGVSLDAAAMHRRVPRYRVTVTVTVELVPWSSDLRERETDQRAARCAPQDGGRGVRPLGTRSRATAETEHSVCRVMNRAL